MKILSCLTGFLILSSFLLSAQSIPSTTFWEKCGNVPHKSLPYHLSINSKGEMLIHRGGAISDAVLLRSVDSGKNWVNISNGLPEVYNFVETTPIKAKYMISDLCAVDSTFYCIQTQSNKEKGWLIRTHDLGKTWDRLAVPDSKIQELMAPKLEGCYLEYSRPKKFNYLFPPEEELLWKNSGDKNWYQKKLWLEKNPGFDINTTPLKIFEYHFRDFTGSTEKTFSIVTNPKKIGYHLNSIDPSGELIKSSDGHESWEVVNTGNIRVTLLNLVDCQGRLYAHLANHTGLHRSSDDGQSWEKLTGISQEDQDNSQYATVYITLGADGRAYTIRGGSIYKSKEPVCCKGKEKPEEPTYGTTIITHGFQSPDSKAPIFEKKGDWAYDMAIAILKRAKNKGCIMRYNKISQTFDIDKGDCSKGEVVLLYDWADESWLINSGFSEAASDILFCSLIEGLKKNKFNLTDIHFIGHSRGTVVNSLTVERLLTLKNLYPEIYNESISIDQVTNINPHDWGVGVSLDNLGFENEMFKTGEYSLCLSDLDDAHPDLSIPFPSDYFPNNGTIAWEGIFSDTYWQENGKPTKANATGYISFNDLLERTIPKKNDPFSLPFKPKHPLVIIGKYIYDNYEITNLNDREVSRTLNFEWSKDEKGAYTTHAGETGLHYLYIKTIYGSVPSLTEGGYGLSRLGGEKNKRLQSGYGIEKPTFNFYENLKSNNSRLNVDRVRGILNGTFDRGALLGVFGFGLPGWKVLNEMGVQLIEEKILLFPTVSDKTAGIQHNKFYLPPDVGKISFKVKAFNVRNGELRIIINNKISGKIINESLPIDADIVRFVEREVDVSGFGDNIVDLRIYFRGESYDPDVSVFPTLELDEVKLIKIPSIHTNGHNNILDPIKNNFNTEEKNIEDFSTDSPNNKWKYNEIITLNSSNSKVLAVGYNSIQPGGKVVIWDDKRQPDIAWELIEHKKDHVKIKNVNSGLFLTVAGGNKQKGAKTTIWSDVGQDDIIWKIEAVQDGKVKVKHVSSGLYLALSYGKFDNGTEVVLWSDENQADIFWEIKKHN